MENYLLVISLLVIAALCWMAGVVKVLLALLVVGAAVSLAADPKSEFAADRLLWSAFLLSRDRTPRSELGLRREYNPLLDADPVELSRYWGYDAEWHYVTTSDGYILGIHRITGRTGPDSNRVDRAGQAGRARPAQGSVQKKPVVVLGHPLLSSSAEWIVIGRDKALAFQLADAGYQVWLMNVRGNTYSLNHTTLTPHDAAFWNFSQNEHGTRDLPGLIEYVIAETGQQKMQYVGFSMGCAIMFIMASERPDLAERITLFTALGPATALVHSRSQVFRLLAHSSPMLMKGAAMVGVHNFLPSTPALRKAGEFFCSDGSLTQGLCVTLIDSLSGRNDPQDNSTLLPYIISRTPAGTSWKTINHYAQSMKLGFKKYDYGHHENVQLYGQSDPPEYNMSKVTIPVRVYYGMNDLLADYRDVRALCARLPNVLNCDAVTDPLWTHLDFVWAKDVPSLIYKKVIADINAAQALVGS